MDARTIGFVVAAIAAAMLFTRLGFWQLDRLDQRQARNAILAARIAAPPAPWSDTTAVRFRRVRLAGIPDYEREIVLVGRSRGGSPGVNIITPLRRAGSDTAVLVNRGWVYSPDATTVDLMAWREGGDSAITVEGYVETFTPPGPGDLPAEQWLARHLSHEAVSARLPYPVAPVYVVAADSATPQLGSPARAAIPRPDEGPHFGYALQWFSFAIIAVVGTGYALVLGRRDRTARRAAQADSPAS